MLGWRRQAQERARLIAEGVGGLDHAPPEHPLTHLALDAWAFMGGAWQPERLALYLRLHPAARAGGNLLLHLLETLRDGA